MSSGWTRSPLLVLGTALLAACASSGTPWVEDGERLGTIRVIERDGGERWEFRDLQKRLVRVERRTAAGEPDPAHPIEHREYDPTGFPTELHYTDRAGRPTLGADGFAARRSRRETSPDGQSSVHHEHFGVGGEALDLAQGYFRETFTYEGRRLLHRRFFDRDEQRVPVALGEWQDVGEIRYAYLQGATPIVMEMFVDSGGEPIHKRRISGHTERRIDQYYQHYGDDPALSFYVGTSVTYSSPGDD